MLPAHLLKVLFALSVLCVFSTEGEAAGADNRGEEQSKVDPDTGVWQLSVSIDPERLFHPVTGWFVEGPGVDPEDWRKTGANFQTHERYPARFTLRTPKGKVVFNGKADFRLFGGMSRLHPQKSFSISLKKKYGQSRINYPVFGPDGPEKFKYLVVRNGGSDWSRSYMRDALLTGLLQDPSWELDYQAHRPVSVSINGKYWGLYFLREKINVHFLAERYGIADKEVIDLLEGRGGAKNGSRRGYDTLIRYIQKNDLSDPGVYREVKQRMNVDNYMRLQIAQTYFGNQDAGGNLRYWRDPTDPNGRWRWLLYDVDQGFGLHSATAYRDNTLQLFTTKNGSAWPNPDWSTFLTRRLLQNEDYRRLFVNRTLDYLHTDFAPERVVAKIDRLAATISSEIPKQSTRWNLKASYWPGQVERLREYARKRPQHLRAHLREQFDAGPDRQFLLTVPEGGFVTLNDNISVEDTTYRASYFAHFPLHLRAVARPKHDFVGWSDGEAAAERWLDLRVDKVHEIKPLFKKQSRIAQLLALAKPEKVVEPEPLRQTRRPENGSVIYTDDEPAPLEDRPPTPDPRQPNQLALMAKATFGVLLLALLTFLAFTRPT